VNGKPEILPWSGRRVVKRENTVLRNFFIGAQDGDKRRSNYPVPTMRSKQVRRSETPCAVGDIMLGGTISKNPAEPRIP